MTYNRLLKHIIGYFSIPSPDTTLYGTESAAHVSSISQPEEESHKSIDDERKENIPASG